MAKRRRKKQADPVEALLTLLIFGAFFLVFNATKSLAAGGIAAGVVLGVYIAIMIVLNQKRAERLKRSGIAEIDMMDGRRFELYLGHLFKAHGYVTEVTQAAGDYGADLVISKAGRKIVVQAKRYSNNVGLKAVQEIYTAIAHYGASEAWVVTNSDYTEQAYTLAKSNGVRLINRQQLIEMILILNPGTQMPSAKQVITEIEFEPEPLVNEEPDDLECPSCGYLLVKRKSSRGDFFGCTNFPKCRHTKAI